jgi:exoribonuclease-2
MLSAEALPLFALGLSDVSPALSFKITLRPDLTIGGTEIIPSLVKVTRLSYAEADALIAGGKLSETGAILASLAALMERNVERRLDTGAVMIDLPEAHISVKNAAKAGEKPFIAVEQIGSFRSADMVRECMLLAGEGAALWALQRQLPIPFISQEAGELPARRLSGLAGAWRLRRCMRARVVSVQPAVHWGLGVDQYTQVTSPLRRYIDLLCHQQIRAVIGGGNYRSIKPLSEEEILVRSSAADAAASTVSQAERASRAHWMGVYLLNNKHLIHDGVVLDRKGNLGTVLIPALGLETQAILNKGSGEPNDSIRLRLSRVKIPEGAVFFVLEG